MHCSFSCCSCMRLSDWLCLGGLNALRAAARSLIMSFLAATRFARIYLLVSAWLRLPAHLLCSTACLLYLYLFSPYPSKVVHEFSCECADLFDLAFCLGCCVQPATLAPSSLLWMRHQPGPVSRQVSSRCALRARSTLCASRSTHCTLRALHAARFACYISPEVRNPFGRNR